MFEKRIPCFIQHDEMDCGPTCLKIVAKYYGKTMGLEYLRGISNLSNMGVSMDNLSNAAEALGFRTIGVHVGINQLQEEVPLPCVAYWKEKHFVVVHKVSANSVSVVDPAVGRIKYSVDEFSEGWKIGDQKGSGFLLLLEPSPQFFNNGGQDSENRFSKGLSILFDYLLLNKTLTLQLIFAVLIGSLIQFFFPFLTQAIVDHGIISLDIHFINLVIIAYGLLILGRVLFDVIRGWILLHLSTRVSVNLISDFLIKLMSLPLSFFDIRKLGDIMQRVNDNKRIEEFLTITSLRTLFNGVNIVIFSIVILYFDVSLFGIFLFGSALHIIWIIFFLSKRKRIDHKRFSQNAENQESLINLVSGIQEIKLNGIKTQKRWEWEEIQAKLFHINVESFKLDYLQASGGVFINEIKNLSIIYISALLVISGDISLGSMLAIQFIVGGLTAAFIELSGFLFKAQDAKISLERMSEIFDQASEKNNPISSLPADKSLSIKNLSFSYVGADRNQVLGNLSFNIPQNKVTAIVGASGSGKTTLIKLLLKFYEYSTGTISAGEFELNQINNDFWRSQCGAVLQDGYIFPDTLLNNIALDKKKIDQQRLAQAIGISNLEEFISELPLGLHTKVGPKGRDLSQGQKQRVLIARVIYKNPTYIFFDEATNSLDAKNEKEIVTKLEKFLKDRTVVVVAHRLSTVKNADQIIVLNQGQIIESGPHQELVNQRGSYFNLIKNQLELGN